MSVDYDLFYEWAKDYFGEENIRIKNTGHGTEICVNSLWSEQKIGKTDTKHHLWMNPSGGKSTKPEFGSYRCWLTDRMGSLVKLVSSLDGIDWDEAEERICGVASLRALELKVHEFFGHIEEKTVIPEPVKQAIIDLPPSCHLIDRLDASHFMKVKAQQYLEKRKISTNGMYVCIAGDYKNRIVIPYYNAEGSLIYYNARLIGDKENAIRYMKCPTTVVDQKEILYMTEWPKRRTKIYIMEGEFDAITMKLCGLVGCACGGKFLSDSQIEMIRYYEPVLAFDADEAGLTSLINIGDTLLERGFPRVSYVRPPKAYKDWNKLYVERNKDTVVSYLSRFEKPYTTDTSAILLSNRI
jgi:DNA primase